MLLAVASASFAQNDRDYIRRGNRLYRAKKFNKAEVEYRKAVAANSENPQAVYNLGCAMMMIQKDSVAVTYFERASQLEQNKLRRAKSNHNIGVILQNHKMYDKAIEAYKNALRDNPNDNETRYNLALCKKLLKKQPKDKDRKKDNKNKDKKQKKQDKDRNNDKKDDNKKQKEQPRKEHMSKDNAEQLLNAAMQDEKQTQQRLQKAMQRPHNVFGGKITDTHRQCAVTCDNRRQLSPVIHGEHTECR